MNPYDQDDVAIDLSRQIACVRREIEQRERDYPRDMKAGRMSLEQAHYELRAMRAVLETLRALERSGALA